MADILWLKCLASKGQFSDEANVRGEDFSGQLFSFSAEARYVQVSGSLDAGFKDALLQVTPLERRGASVLIRLPTGLSSKGSTTMTVREEDLTQALEFGSRYETPPRSRKEAA